MSEMYNAENTLTKGHQQRSCAVCGDPIVDDKAATLPIGGGLELLVHRSCLNELTEAMQPKVVTIPIPTTKPVSVRKSTVANSQPLDKETMLDRTRYEFVKLLLELKQ